MNNFDWDAEYTEEDFEKMMIPLYSDTGYPYLDEFGYMSACVHNERIEHLRQQYFARKAKREQENSQA
jgi:hypothetical protein